LDNAKQIDVEHSIKDSSSSKPKVNEVERTANSLRSLSHAYVRTIGTDAADLLLKAAAQLDALSALKLPEAFDQTRLLHR
jgi:hypothetical protein